MSPELNDLKQQHPVEGTEPVKMGRVPVLEGVPFSMERRPPTVLPVSMPEPNVTDGFGALAYAALALLLASTALLGFWYLDARKAVATAKEERLEREAHWKVVSNRLHDAKARRPALEAQLGQPARIAADRALPRWSSALGAIAETAGENIEIRGIEGRPEPDQPGVCEVRIDGSVGGSNPRFAADRFRVASEKNLKRVAGLLPVSTRIEELDDIPSAPGALPDQQRAVFVMIATVGADNPPTAEKGEAH